MVDGYTDGAEVKFLSLDVHMELEDRLRALLLADSWLMEILRAVRAADLPDWYIGAGVIRGLVWDHLHGFVEKTAVNDVDVAYFDPTDLQRQQEHLYQATLEANLPDVRWEVTNQAAVHLWYPDYFGYEVEPLVSTEDAIATWPETATAVAVRLLPADQIQVYAPLGLEDLFGLILRRNPRQVSLEQFRQRAIRKQIVQKWPQVMIVDG